MIPKRVHFIWIASPEYGVPSFGFTEWLAVRSVLKTNPDFEVNFWTDHEPAGKYFAAIRGDVHIEPIESPVRVFGTPIPHPAHKCDWLRLQVLYRHGGIYLDMDTITVRDLGRLMTPPATMVAETANGETVGLCNAFIAAEAGSTFVRDWIERFRDFRSMGRDQYWNDPGKWAHQLYRAGAEVIAMPAMEFFKPDWTEDGIASMFDRVEEFPHATGFHLWSAITRNRLQKLNETSYDATDCTFSRIVKSILEDEIRTELV